MLQACGQNVEPVQEQEVTEWPVLQEFSEIQILTGEHLMYGGSTLLQEDVTGYWTPDRSQVDLILRELPEYAKDNPPRAGSDFWKEISLLLEYVIGYEVSGKRYIEFGSFPVYTFEDGTTRPGRVLDGGPQFYQGTLDVESNRIMFILYNGLA